MRNNWAIAAAALLGAFGGANWVAAAMAAAPNFGGGPVLPRHRSAGSRSHREWRKRRSSGRV